MLIDATMKGADKFSTEKHNFSIAVNTQPSGDVDLRTSLSNFNIDQPNWVPFLTTTTTTTTAPLCSNAQVGNHPTYYSVELSLPLITRSQFCQQLQDPTTFSPSLLNDQFQQEPQQSKSPQQIQKQPQQQQQQAVAADQMQLSQQQEVTKLKQQHSLKQILPATQQQIQQLKQQQAQSQQQQQPQPQQSQVQQKQKSLPLQQQKQLLQQKQQMQQQHFQQLQQKFQSQKQQSSSVNANDHLGLNSQARQELHRHLNEMKVIAQSAATTQQNQNAVTSKFS
jgi:hypothetical protein